MNSRSSSREDALTDAIRSAVALSGTFCLLHPPQTSREENPRRLSLRDEDGKDVDVWIYAWWLPDVETVKPPGIGQPAELAERAVLFKPVYSNPSGTTVLLGYDRAARVFVGYDFNEYLGWKQDSFTRHIHEPRLPDPEMLVEARTNGLSFRRDPEEGIYVGVRPDHLATYLQFGEEIHREGGRSDVFPVLEKIGRGLQQDSGEMLPPDAPPWLFALSEANNRWTFKDRVREAYRNTCILSGIQMGLLDSAHIYPQKQKDSSHLVSNGFLMQPTLHRAHDHALIYLVLTEDGSYEFHPNEIAMNNAVLDYGRDGLAYLESFLNKPLKAVPKKKHMRPEIRWIRKSYTYYDISLMSHLFWMDADEDKWKRERNPKS